MANTKGDCFMKKVFIDGSAGTTGLRIFERLGARCDIEIIKLTEENRKVPEKRKEALNAADAAFLCLPDAAAIEAVEMLENPDTVVLDTSTAHRTDAGWAYGFPELSEKHMANVKTSKRIAVPGCHASGFIALVYPLVEAGLIDKSACLACTSLTGYSGGGKKMIAQYQDKERAALLDSPLQYGLTQSHKHLKEMRAVPGLDNAPAFMPIVADYYSGMQVTVPLFASMINGSAEDIKKVYAEKYAGPVVNYAEAPEDFGYAAFSAGLDSMKISVQGNDDRVLLIASFDNLGKGASGAAVQCMNLAFGFEMTEGLSL